MRDDSEPIRLPANFIGIEDEARLQGFAGHLMAHGCAARWQWRRVDGIAVELSIFAIDPDGASLLAAISRDSSRDVYRASDRDAAVFVEGTLEKVMTIVDRLARASVPESPA